MKKLILLGVGLCATVGAMAQIDLVKQVERDIKGANPNYSQALAAIQPALTNSETAGMMNTWYVAGKTAFGVFDDLLKKITVNQTPSPEEMRNAGVALCDGFDYYIKALSLDSLPDEKGKIKPKKSGEILKTLKASHPKLTNAANYLHEIGDFDNTYRAYKIYAETPSMPQLAKNPPKELDDTIRGNVYLCMAQALLLSDQEKHDVEKVTKALEILELIPATGYNDEKTYQFALAAAYVLNDKAATSRWAKEANEKYGTSNVQYIGILINNELDSEHFPEARALVDKAIGVVTPDNNTMLSELYNIRGTINIRDSKFVDAKGDFEKSLSYNPEYYKSMYLFGIAILGDIEAQQNANENLPIIFFKDDLLKAADLLEKAYNHDEMQYSDAAYRLYSIYYNLGNDYVEQAKYWEQLK